jgi:hypothetical protein
MPGASAEVSKARHKTRPTGRFTPFHPRPSACRCGRLTSATNTIGSVVVAAFVGRLIQRLGVSVLLAVAGACAALGGVGYAVAPGLWLILTIGPLLGAAAGMQAVSVGRPAGVRRL